MKELLLLFFCIFLCFLIFFIIKNENKKSIKDEEILNDIKKTISKIENKESNLPNIKLDKIVELMVAKYNLSGKRKKKILESLELMLVPESYVVSFGVVNGKKSSWKEIKIPENSERAK